MPIRHSTAIALFLAACAAGSMTAPPGLAEQAIQAEKNPPGDIPDTQVFVSYRGTGATMQIPEGWGRSDEANGAVFSDKYNRIEVTWTASSGPLTATSVTSGEIKAMLANGRAVNITAVKEVKLDGGRAVRIDYSANSEPNAVTNKQIRLEGVRFYLEGAGGRMAVLDMTAPFGADNVDQWNLMANSLRIK